MVMRVPSFMSTTIQRAIDNGYPMTAYPGGFLIDYPTIDSQGFGVKGDTGLQGIQGVKGDIGLQGIQGIKGDIGLQGIQGIKGDIGLQGIQGIPGGSITTAAQLPITDPGGLLEATEVEAALQEVAGKIALVPWITPTLLNGWVNTSAGYYPTAKYHKEHDGLISVQGMISSGVIGSPIFVLPIGYRPVGPTLFPIVSSDLFGIVGVDSNGSVTCSVGNNGWVSLSTIRFKAEG